MKNQTKNKGLTFTVVCLAQSANYGEGLGNVTSLKKMTRGDGHQYSYISRRALRYSLVGSAGWDNTPVEGQGKGENQVIQFAPQATIEDYPEIDFFGYMKTVSKTDKEKGGASKRSAVVRLSDAISLEPFACDLDFLNNMGLASRINASNNLAQSEEHLSYYTFTVTVDLDQVGIDGDVEVSDEEKANRMEQLLEEFEFLNRDIKGRNENLNPMFVVGGIYKRKNPFFKDRVKVNSNAINVETVKEIKESYDWLNEQTHVGVVSGLFANDEEIKTVLNASSVSEFFKKLRQEVRDYYVN